MAEHSPQSEPSTPGWRGRGRPKSAPASQHRWQEKKLDQQQRASARKVFRHRLKLGAATLSLAVLLALFLFWVFFMPRPAPLIALAVTRYAAPLPPNAWAAEDLQRFSEDPGSSVARRNLTVIPAGPWESKRDAIEDLRQRIAGATPGGPGRNVVLLYISAHGVINAEGEPCLILADPARDPAAERQSLSYLDPKRWLPVRQIVAELDAQAKGAKKLLILDCNRMHANWSIGLLYNGFAERLPRAVRGFKNVAILNSTAGDQVGWSSAELQSSPFGFFVWRGLRGYDDSDKDGDGKVSLRELQAYVASRVRGWVLRSRFDLQTPVLVPEDAGDFDLVWTETEPPADQAENISASAPVSTRAAQLWQRHERWQAQLASGQLGSGAWLKLRHFERRLLRLEQLEQAGSAYALEAAEELDALSAVDLSRKVDPGIAAHNLPLATAWTAGPSDDGHAAATADLVKAVLDSSIKQPRLEDYQAAIRAQAAWSAVLEDPRPEPLRRALAVAAYQPSAGPEPVEIAFMRLLEGQLPSTAWNDPSVTIAPALRCRQAAEQLARPGDERVHYAVRMLVAAADNERRLAEDNLFIGGPADLSEAAVKCQAAASAYERASARSSQVGHAYRVRDRAFAELPYLAQWLAGRPSPEQADEDDIADLNRQMEILLAAVAGNHVLAEQIEQYVDDCAKTAGVDDDSDGRLAETTLQVERNLDRLERLFRDRFEEVLRQAKDQRTLREIHALLTCPLISGADRRQLWAIYRQIADRSSPYRQPGGTEKPGDDGPPRQLARMARWTVHPALAILDAGREIRSGRAARDVEIDVQDQIEQLARDGEEVRTILASADGQAAQWLESKAASDGSPRAARQGLSKADRLVRATAGLWGTDDVVADDPCDLLFRFDLAQLLLWQSDRALEDFWGPMASPDGEVAYFAAVVESYRKAAKQLYPVELPGWRRQGELAANRQEASQRAVAAATEDTRPVSGSTGIDKEILVEWAANLPRGKAALAVYDAANEPVAIRAGPEQPYQPRFALPVGATAASSSYSVELRPAGTGDQASAGGGEGSWELVAYYRGHREVGRFQVLPLGRGIELVHQRQIYPTASVTVLGEARNPGSVVFILDCSSSMQAPGRTQRRMNAARDALVRIIQQLSDAGQYNVGLWLYGHRVGVDAKGEPQWNQAWKVRDPNLLPSDDVQQVFATELLDAQRVKEVISLLNDRSRVGPWGRTPLNRSMVEAIEQDLSRQPKQFPRRLIVITDGTDLVTQAGDRWRPPPGTLKTEDDVAKAFRNDHEGRLDQRIRMDVVGVAIEGAADLENFVEKHPDIRGRYHSVSDLDRLLDQLTKALGLYKYSVDPARPGTAGPELPQRSLGQGVEIDTREGGRLEYAIRLVGTDPPVRGLVSIEGGEALELFLNRDADLWRLVHQRYDRQGETSDTCDGNANPLAMAGGDPSNPRQFHVAAHRPEPLSQRTVRFPISIQNDDAQAFSPRPAEAWVRIEPVFEEPRSDVFAYPIYDLSFEEGRPVPVLECLTPDWPLDAQGAKIEVWFKMQKTRPTKEVMVGDVAGLDDRANPDLGVSGAPDVEFAVLTGPSASDADASVIQVIQRHPAGAAPLDSVKIEMLQPADEIRHEYFPQGRLVRHSFVYRDTEEAELQRYRLRLTSFRDLDRDAVRLNRPLTVRFQPRR